MSGLAPIVLFVYNRPEHTRNTLTALKANRLSVDSHLFIFADGPKESASSKDHADIQSTRKVIREQEWCGTVTVVERPANIGLAENIIDGVTNIVNAHGKIIVLEDDIVTSESFLTYMNNALDLYNQDPQVMHVAGYSFPWLDASRIGMDTFFYRVASCWGWGTWARAWKFYHDDSEKLFVRLCEKNKMSSFDLGYSGGFLGQLNANIVKSARTWAVKWYASVHLQNGLALHPAKSLVNNTGFDNSGENSAATSMFENETLGSLDHVVREQIVENKYVVSTMYTRYRNSIARKVKIFLANRIKNFIRLKYFTSH